MYIFLFFYIICLAPAKIGEGENALTDLECWDLFIQVCSI